MTEQINGQILHSSEKSFFQVTLKIETLADNGKIKKVTEKYIVHTTSPEEAVKIVQNDMKDCIYEWLVSSVVLLKISKIIM